MSNIINNTIGNIIFYDYIDETEESKINNIFKSNHIVKCKVEVYSEEGPIPHFHIVGVNTYFDCCVRIYDNHFFKHGIHKCFFNTKQCHQLYDWLKRTNDKIDPTKSNWHVIEQQWIVNNPRCLYPADKKCIDMPDYRKMKDFKSGI